MGRVFLVVGFFLSSLYIYHGTPFWPTKSVLKSQLITLWGFPCMLFVAFSLVAFNILSLYLTFVSLINMCLIMFLLGFILYGTLCFLDLDDYFLSQVREVFNFDLFKYFLRAFLFFFFFWNTYNSNVGVLNVVPEVSETIRISFFFFVFFLFLTSLLE